MDGLKDGKKPRFEIPKREIRRDLDEDVVAEVVNKGIDQNPNTPTTPEQKAVYTPPPTVDTSFKSHGVYASGSWDRTRKAECPIAQVNVDVPATLRDELDGFGEGTKNLRHAYYYTLGLAAAKLASQFQEVEITDRGLLKLMERLNQDPTHLRKVIGS